MVKIVLPTMAVYRDDVVRMWGLLEKTAGKEGYEIGLQIVGTLENFQKEEDLDKTRKNIMSVAKGAYIIIHSIYGIPVYENRTGDMRTREGIKHLENLLRLAEDIGAHYVNVHTSAGYRGERLSFGKRRKELDRIRNNLLDCKNRMGSRCELGVENLPNPAMGDYLSGSTDVWRDVVDSIEDCLYIVRGTDLKVTLDTCHYAANKIGKIDIVGAVEDKHKELEERLGKYLYHVHLNDVYGYWVPNRSVWTEGIIPGNGNIGEDSFRDFLAYIKVNHSDIGICIEVYNADYSNPVESEESIRRVLGWLK